MPTEREPLPDVNGWEAQFLQMIVFTSQPPSLDFPPIWSAFTGEQPETTTRSRVERWRGGLGNGMSVCPGFPFVAQNRRPYPVSTSRSSNRTGGFPASGSPTGFGPMAHGAACQPHLRQGPSSFRSVRVVVWR